MPVVTGLLYVVVLFQLSFALQLRAQAGGSQPNAVQPIQRSAVAQYPKNFTLRFGQAGEIVSLSDGRLTLKVINRKLSTLIGLISIKTGIPVIDLQGVLDNHKVSRDFRDLPFDDAIKSVLSDFDTFYLYSAGDADNRPVLQQVWVYQKGQGKGFDPVPFEACASNKELRVMVHSTDPGVKGRALETLLSREGDKARDLVIQLLSSNNAQDRNLALYYALDNSVEIPIETLTSLAVGDGSPAVRVMALDGLVGRNPEAAEWVFVQALSDPDALVRARAQEIVDATSVTNIDQRKLK